MKQLFQGLRPHSHPGYSSRATVHENLHFMENGASFTNSRQAGRVSRNTNQLINRLLNGHL